VKFYKYCNYIYKQIKTYHFYSLKSIQYIHWINLKHLREKRNIAITSLAKGKPRLSMHQQNCLRVQLCKAHSWQLSNWFGLHPFRMITNQKLLPLGIVIFLHNDSCLYISLIECNKNYFMIEIQLLKKYINRYSNLSKSSKISKFIVTSFPWCPLTLFLSN